MSEGFLSRWSRRKQEARQEQSAPVLEGASVAPAGATVAEGIQPTPESSILPQSVEINLPLPTEADLPSVKAGGDVVAFMQNKVAPELRNKALKTLFSRPEFNVMDGLDIYIDDYNVFTPMDQSDIDKMALAKQLLSRPDLEPPVETAQPPEVVASEQDQPLIEGTGNSPADQAGDDSTEATMAPTEHNETGVQATTPVLPGFVQPVSDKSDPL